MSTINDVTPSSSSSAAPAVAAARQQYRDIQAECSRIMGKIFELEQDRNEHKLVEETLQPLESNRRAFRLVGECLVERTVGEILPSVTANRENVRCCCCCFFFGRGLLH